MRRVLAALCIAVLVATAAGAATLGTALDSLRDWLILGGGNHDSQQTWDGFWCAVNGDLTTTITIPDQTTDSLDHYVAWSQTVRVACTNASGDINYWYNGLLAIAVSEDVSGDVHLSNSGDVTLTNGYVDLTISGTDTDPVLGKSVFVVASIDKFKPFGVSRDYNMGRTYEGWLYKNEETIAQ